MKYTSGMQKKIGLLIILIVFFISTTASADKVKKPINAKRLVPACLLAWNSGPEYTVIVDKSRQKVMVYKRGDLFDPYKVYDCSTGEHSGPKVQKNDRKTPEGIYFFTGSVDERYLSPVYGAHALPLNYPNIIDREEGKDGYGIWFHGTNKPLKPHDTNGCIEMRNHDILQLAKIVSIFDTPVIIGSRIKMIPEGQLDSKRNELRNIIEEWRSSWQGKDIKKYMSFYSKKFTSDHGNWYKWRAYKTRLAKKYSRINVEVNNLGLWYYNGVIVALFDQDYSTPSFDSYGIKRLYLVRNSAQWKILGETFRGKNKPKWVLKKSYPFNKREIRDFISSWKEAWEKKELGKYISYYDRNFRSRGMDLDAWQAHRRRLNKKYRTVQVDIKNLKIKSISSGKKAEVSFTQDYRADSYRDKGKKKILLVRKGKDWKIKQEDWTPIR